MNRNVSVFHNRWLAVIALLCPAALSADVETYNSPGAHTFTVPAYVSEFTVELWGAGGSGRGSGGGGGGGGAYASFTVEDVASGDAYNITVGAGAVNASGGASLIRDGDSGVTLVSAAGGNRATGSSGAGGGSVGDYRGGNGASGSSGIFGVGARGGGGGSSAGTGANGSNGSGGSGGSAPSGGGDGGREGGSVVGLFSGNGEPGYAPGGGGGGGGASLLGLGSTAGGRGGHGQVRISFEVDEPPLEYFEISHSGAGLTCRPEVITIKACESAGCATTFNGPVTVTLSPSGWDGGTEVSFSGGQTTVDFIKTSPGTVTLDAGSSTPAASGSPDTLCRAGGGPASVAACNLEFFSSALEFDAPDVTAGKSSDTFLVSAVSTDPATSACVPSFANVTRPVDFWTNHEVPSGGDLSATPGIWINGVETGVGIGGRATVSLDFDGNGEAEVEALYSEAGQVQLVGVYEGSAGRGDEGLTMLGFDSFTSIPAGFCVSADSTDAECTGTLSDCSVLAAAGDPFDLTVRAVAWEAEGETDTDFCSGNATTRNFRHGGLSLAHTLVAPVDEAPGTISVDLVPFVKDDEGSKRVANQTVSEVGVFRFSVPDGETYLSRSLNGAASANVGRFTPADFEVTVVDHGTLQATCTSGATSFAYIGQAVSWSTSLLPDIHITARNADGDTTENYTSDGFLKLVLGDLSRSGPTEDDTESLPVSHVPGPENLEPHTTLPGVMVYKFSVLDELTYTKQITAQRSPFTPSVSYTLGSFSDSDSVAAVTPLPEVTPEANFEMRYGRLALTNVSGPENSGTLIMPFQTEYWDEDQERYLLNEDDSCTPWDTANITYSASSPPPSAHGTLTPASGTISGGRGDGLALEPEGTQGTDIATWTVPPWLQDDWDGDGSLENPQGMATFGVYRGSDRIIHWRER